MTLALATLTSSGIILSADSRQTYRNMAGMIRIGSESAMKLFKLTDRAGAVVAGRAFLGDAQGTNKTVGSFIEEFQRTQLSGPVSTKEIATRLNEYLAALYVAREMSKLREQIQAEVAKRHGTDLSFKNQDGNLQPYSYKTQDGSVIQDTGSIETVELIVAGIDEDKTGRACHLSVPKGIVSEKDTKECGAMWIGQTDILVRIIKGFDPAMGALAFLREADGRRPGEPRAELDKLEYIVNWATMTLQDAVDFCILMIRTTESIQRFSDGTVLSPGGITGVGGEIALAAITPQRGFTWIKKKFVTGEGVAVDLD